MEKYTLKQCLLFKWAIPIVLARGGGNVDNLDVPLKNVLHHWLHVFDRLNTMDLDIVVDNTKLPKQSEMQYHCWTETCSAHSFLSLGI